MLLKELVPSWKWCMMGLLSEDSIILHLDLPGTALPRNVLITSPQSWPGLDHLCSDAEPAQPPWPGVRVSPESLLAQIYFTGSTVRFEILIIVLPITGCLLHVRDKSSADECTLNLLLSCFICVPQKRTKSCSPLISVTLKERVDVFDTL